MRRFLFYILKEDGRSGKVINDVVTFSGQPTPLPQSPDGWQDTQVAWERNISDHGVIRNFSLPFGFVMDGAKIIRDAIYNQSIEEKLFLLIQVLTLEYVDNTSYKWVYKYQYKGELDLTAAEDNLDMVNVPCMEGGLHKLLKANRSKKYTIPFDEDAVTVELDGIALQENSNYVCEGAISNAVFFNSHTLPITFVNKDGISSGVGFFTQSVEDITPSRPFYVGASANYFLINDSGVSQTFTLKGTIFYMCTENSAGLSYRWRLVRDDDSEIDIYNSLTNPVQGVTYEVAIDETFTLVDGAKMFLIGTYFGAGGVTIICDFLEQSELNLTFESTGAATKTLAFTKDVLYRKLIGKLTGNEANASSDLCEENKYLVVTSGDAIRQLPEPVIVTSLNDFFADMDSTFMAGLSVDALNDVIEIEARAKYYDNSDPIDLGTIKDLSITPANTYRFNTFKFGHPKPDIEDINGKLDPNGSSEFSGPLLKAAKDYSMISPYKAGPYEIESLRRNLDGKVTTDDNRDSGVYVIACDSHKTIIADIGFFAAGFITISSAQYLAAGQQIQFSGSSFNDGIYNITDIGSAIIFQIVSLTGTLVDETALNVTITILRGEVLTLKRPAYSLLEGVPTETIFNLPYLTPKTMLFEHGRWINSMHKGLENKKIVFDSSDKNALLKTTLAGVTIDEDKDELISSLGSSIFLPFFVSFTTQTPVDIVTILEETPNRCFTFYDDQRGVNIEGFLMAAGFAPNDLKEQEFRVLLTSNNNLNLLT